MKLNFETAFTEQEYDKLLQAIKDKQDYEFDYGGHKSKMRVVLSGRNCDNGIWLPENYLWVGKPNRHPKRLHGARQTLQGQRTKDPKPNH